MDQGSIGKFIAELRRENGLTQAQLGEKLGVTNKTVSRWENGNYMPDLAAIPALAAQLGVSVSELLAGEHFEETEYKRSADEQLLKVMQLVNEVREVRNSFWLISGFSQVALIFCLPMLLIALLSPSFDGEISIPLWAFGISVLIMVVGFGVKLILRKSSLLLSFGIMLYVFLCMYGEIDNVYYTGVMIVPFTFGIMFLVLAVLGYRVYFNTIDKLLEQTKEK